jgi:hypothetical protein
MNNLFAIMLMGLATASVACADDASAFAKRRPVPIQQVVIADEFWSPKRKV